MSKFGKFWRTIGAGAAGMAALAAVNARIRRNAHEPDDGGFGGEARSFEWQYGNVFYKVGGEEHDGVPLVLVHGIGAGASSFMWRRNFDDLARDFRVYALDLLGFGFSDKPAGVPYSAGLYVELIADFIREVVGLPAHLVASSLSAAYSICVADEQAELVKSLLLISPTGTGNLRARPGMSGAAFYGLLQSPVLGTSFYNVITSERGIRDYARDELFFDKRRATPRLVSQYYGTSHQPGAQYAIAAFLSGYLNTDTQESFARLRQPVTLCWGKQDRTNTLERAAELLSLNPRAGLEIFDRCRMMPQEEQPEKFNALVRNKLRARSAAA
jgi:pimeloyl-ACP methyl ester carboxylesterase